MYFEAPIVKWSSTNPSYYLTGKFVDPKSGRNVDWSADGNMHFAEVTKNVLYKIEGIVLRKDTDFIKACKANKRGTGLDAGGWMPDGVENDLIPPEDGVYTIWLRPAGDGTEEDGYFYSWYDDGSGSGGGAKLVGGYLIKFEKTGDIKG